MRIEVLGPGCPKCMNTEQNVKNALSELKMHADVVKVTDISAIIEKGVMWTPALVIDGKLALQGKTPGGMIAWRAKVHGEGFRGRISLGFQL